MFIRVFDIMDSEAVLLNCSKVSKIYTLDKKNNELKVKIVLDDRSIIKGMIEENDFYDLYSIGARLDSIKKALWEINNSIKEFDETMNAKQYATTVNM